MPFAGGEAMSMMNSSRPKLLYIDATSFSNKCVISTKFALDEFRVDIALHLKAQRFARGFVGILNIPNKFALDIHNRHRLAFENPEICKRVCSIFKSILQV